MFSLVDYMRSYEAKEEFKERMSKLLDGKADEERFWKIARTGAPHVIRCNTLKISAGDLKKRLESRGWKIGQPFSKNPEVMIVESRLGPGELGKAKEHLLGYFYVQDISSMLPVIALKPGKDDSLLDIAASPGSKTTQAVAMMENQGILIANDVSLSRLRILNSNLQKCGVMNVVVTRKEGVALCKRIKERSNLRFDKILADVPCTGEGTIRKSPKTLLMWNKNFVLKLAGIQRRIAGACFDLLKEGGEMVYSTCTLAPEENEGVVDYLIKEFGAKVLPVSLELKTRPGVTEWEGKEFDDSVKNCVRVYPQDNDTHGFFLARLGRGRLGE